MFQEFQFKYVFGSDAVKSSLKLLAEHRSKARKEIEAVRSGKDTVSATSYFSDAARKQTERLREDRERKMEKEKDRRLAEMDKAAHVDSPNKQRYERFVHSSIVRFVDL